MQPYRPSSGGGFKRRNAPGLATVGVRWRALQTRQQNKGFIGNSSLWSNVLQNRTVHPRFATKTDHPDDVSGEPKEARLCRMYSTVSARSQLSQQTS